MHIVFMILKLQASLSGLWDEMQRDRRKPHNVRFDHYLITRFMKGERHWFSVDQASKHNACKKQIKITEPINS